MAEHYWYKDLFLRTTELIQIISFEGDIVAVNPAWLKTMEYNLEEVIGRSIYDFPDPKKRAAYIQFREQLIASRSEGEISTVFITRSGKRIHLRGWMEHISSADREYSRAILRNSTEEAYNAEQNELNKKRLETIFYHAPDAIITINENHEILEWNPRAAQIFGYTEAEVKGKLIHQIIIPPELREAHEKGMSRFLETGHGPVLNKTIEVPAMKSTGDRFFVALTISQVRVNDAWLFIAFLSDVTEKKRLEAQNREGEIQLKVQKELNEEKDQFLSIASHELKTPLTNLQLLIQLSENTIDSGSIEKVREYLGKTLKHIHAINKIIEDLLNFDRIREDKFRFHVDRFDLSETLNDIVNNYRTLHPSHRFIYAPSGKCIATVDEEKIIQVLYNLLNNAVRYSPAGSDIIISISAKDNYYHVRVSDQGIGVPEMEREHIFKRFYRAENALYNTQGLGIGMHISREIVERHKGEIWVETNGEKGSTFIFTIPVS